MKYELLIRGWEARRNARGAARAREPSLRSSITARFPATFDHLPYLILIPGAALTSHITSTASVIDGAQELIHKNAVAHFWLGHRLRYVSTQPRIRCIVLSQR